MTEWYSFWALLDALVTPETLDGDDLKCLIADIEIEIAATRP